MEEQIIDVIEEPTEETIPVEEENVIVNTGGTQNYNDLYNKPQINNVELEGNLSLSDLGIENYDDTEIKSDINDLETNKADKSEIPKNTSDLINNSGFITNSVSNLTNYYLKSQVYTKTEAYNKDEVNSLIGAISTIQIEVVQQLPATGETNKIYFVPKTPDTNDNYDEFIYINNAWEKIGDTKADLTGYATETWVGTQISDFLTELEIQGLISTALNNYYTKAETNLLLNNKANTSDIPTNLNQLSNADTKFTSSSYISNIWYGTEAEYNAIAEKDSNTLYLLEE